MITEYFNFEEQLCRTTAMHLDSDNESTSSRLVRDAFDNKQKTNSLIDGTDARTAAAPGQSARCFILSEV